MPQTLGTLGPVHHRPPLHLERELVVADADLGMDDEDDKMTIMLFKREQIQIT